MKFCIKCGAKLDDRANFCADCGTAVTKKNIPIKAPVKQEKIENEVKTGEISDFVEQIFLVCQEVQQGIHRKFETGQRTVASNEGKEILKNSFKTIAVKLDITESTVRDKCTRQLGINTEELFSHIWQYTSTNGSTTLEDIVIDRKKKDDSINDIRKKFGSIRNTNKGTLRKS